jgi:hypothetical protein
MPLDRSNGGPENWPGLEFFTILKRGRFNGRRLETTEKNAAMEELGRHLEILVFVLDSHNFGAHFRIQYRI